MSNSNWNKLELKSGDKDLQSTLRKKKKKKSTNM